MEKIRIEVLGKKSETEKNMEIMRTEQLVKMVDGI